MAPLATSQSCSMHLRMDQMGFLPASSRPSRRGRISCGRCGTRIMLTDRIRKDGDGFVHEFCPEADTLPMAPTIPEQRS